MNTAATRRIELLAAARAVVKLYVGELNGKSPNRLGAYVRLEQAIAAYNEVPVPDRMIEDTLAMAAEDSQSQADCDLAGDLLATVERAPRWEQQ